jgi:hypothetical protein
MSADDAHATSTIAPEQVRLEDGPRLRLERRYDHRVERVWRALTDSDQLDKWFPPGEDLQVTESQPPSLLAGSWYGDRWSAGPRFTNATPRTSGSIRSSAARPLPSTTARPPQRVHSALRAPSVSRQPRLPSSSARPFSLSSASSS